jgi:hypothetical protein
LFIAQSELKEKSTLASVLTTQVQEVALLMKRYSAGIESNIFALA